MAGDWIKMRTNLWDDPRISQLCDMTDASEAAVIGALYWLWATADEHTEDGLLAGMSCAGIDRKTGVRGIGNALVTIGWLSANDDGVTVCRFTEHNGASAKTRAQTAKRVANHKTKNSGKSEAESNADSVSGSLPERQQGVSGALPREDIDIDKDSTLYTHAPATPVELSIAFRSAGVQSQPADPRLHALAEQGVTVGTVAAACIEAKRAKPGEQIALGYVVKIIERWARDAAKTAANGAMVPPAHTGGQRPAKFDPVAHVNRNRAVVSQ